MCWITSMARNNSKLPDKNGPAIQYVSAQSHSPYPFPAESNNYLAAHVQFMCESLRSRCGRVLADPGFGPIEAARLIFHAPFVVLSHNTAEDPVLTYANLAGLALFELDWDQLVVTPSRYTAEAPAREARNRLLARVAADGFIDDYSGVRISTSGRRFLIEKATVWNIKDSQGVARGQAATFDRWRALS